MNPAFGRERGKKRAWKSPQKRHCLEFAVQLALKAFFSAVLPSFQTVQHTFCSEHTHDWLALYQRAALQARASSGCSERELILLYVHFLHMACASDDTALSGCFACLVVHEYSK